MEEIDRTNSEKEVDLGQEAEKMTDSKTYKTTLCQFYLKGPCKNGEDCSYAHGTSELRSASGSSIAEIGLFSHQRFCLHEKYLEMSLGSQASPQKILPKTVERTELLKVFEFRG